MVKLDTILSDVGLGGTTDFVKRNIGVILSWILLLIECSSVTDQTMDTE